MTYYTDNQCKILKAQEERGINLSKISIQKDLEKRKNGGKVLSVILRPDGSSYTQSIRVQGKWLEKFGFILGDLVKIQARKHKIIITKI